MVFSSQTKRSDVSHFQMPSCHATQEWVECVIIINLQYLSHRSAMVFLLFFCRYGEEQTSLCAHKITWWLEAYLDKHTHNGNTTFVPFNAIHSHYRVLEWPNPFIIVCIGANGIFDVASLCISCKIRCIQFILYYNMENSTIQEVLLVWWWCSFKLKLLAVKL